MDILRAIEERNSTRGYLDQPVERETLEKLISLATRAPSAVNLQPWEIIVVSGEERKRLSRLLVKRMRERNRRRTSSSVATLTVAILPFTSGSMRNYNIGLTSIFCPRSGPTQTRLIEQEISSSNLARYSRARSGNCSYCRIPLVSTCQPGISS